MSAPLKVLNHGDHEPVVGLVRVRTFCMVQLRTSASAFHWTFSVSLTHEVVSRRKLYAAQAALIMRFHEVAKQFAGLSLSVLYDDATGKLS